MDTDLFLVDTCLVNRATCLVNRAPTVTLANSITFWAICMYQCALKYVKYSLCIMYFILKRNTRYYYNSWLTDKENKAKKINIMSCRWFSQSRSADSVPHALNQWAYLIQNYYLTFVSSILSGNNRRDDNLYQREIILWEIIF